MILLVQLPLQTQSLLAMVVTGLLLAALSAYVIPLLNPKKDITPRPLSWTGWALMMGVSVYSQIMKEGWQWNQTSLIISVIGCTSIAILSIRRGTIEPWDWMCLVFGIICIVIYCRTKDPWLTTIVAIIGDFIIGIPTQHNAYIDPKSEKSIAWSLGLAAYVVNIVNCIGYDLLTIAFPVYLLMTNSFMVYLTNRKIIRTPKVKP